MKLAACISVYNEEGKLDRCLNSLVGFVDEIMVVDGVMWDVQERRRCFFDLLKLWPGSTDGTHEAFLRFKLEHPSLRLWWIPNNGGWISEVWKRNYMLDAYRRLNSIEECPDAWFFVIDGDEYLEGNRVEAKAELEKLNNRKALSASILLRRLGMKDDEYWMPRFYRWDPTLHYCRNHYSVCILNGKGEHVDLTSTRAKVNSVWLMHDPSPEV